MKNIRKKLLLTRMSLEMSIFLKWASIKLPFNGNDEITSTISSEKIESTDSCLDFDDEDYSKPSLDFLDIRIRNSREEIALLYDNINFLIAISKNRSDIVTLILEQYFIDGKISEYTIEVFLDSCVIVFSQEERRLLKGLIDVDTKKEVLN